MDFNGAQAAIGYTFQNTNLLQEAFSTAGVSHNRPSGHKRLAKVGVSVLQLILSRYWYPTQLPMRNIDVTSKRRLTPTSLAAICLASGLDAFILYNPSLSREESTPDSILSETMLATIAAVWLDSGDSLNEARAVIVRFGLLQTDGSGILDWTYFADLI